MNMHQEAVITMKDVTFAYNSVPVIEDVNLTINSRDSLCIVGPNGSGKTTLLKLILGLLKPEHGTILVFDKKPEQALANIGYVPQYAHYDPLFPVTVMDVVLMGRLGRHLGGPYSKEDKEAARTALAEMNLSPLAGKLFAAISGGQRQRVLIARAIAGEPQLLVLDEPTANIDPQAQISFFELLKKFNQRMTILLVTHDIGIVSKVFTRVACVNRRVVIHPTSDLTGDMIQDLYGGNFCMIRHDHRCSEKGHQHDRIC